MVDFVEICNVCARKATIEAAKRIINSDKVCRSYSDLKFGVTFLEHSVVFSSLCIPLDEVTPTMKKTINIYTSIKGLYRDCIATCGEHKSSRCTW